MVVNTFFLLVVNDKTDELRLTCGVNGRLCVEEPQEEEEEEEAAGWGVVRGATPPRVTTAPILP